MDFSLPEELLAKAHQAPSGELAWPPGAVMEAVRQFAAQGFALIGGEVWIVSPQKVHKLVRLRNYEIGTLEWHTIGWDYETDWMEYCRQTAEATLREILALQASQKVLPEHAPYIHYHLIFVDEHDYRENAEQL